MVVLGLVRQTLSLADICTSKTGITLQHAVGSGCLWKRKKRRDVSHVHMYSTVLWNYPVWCQAYIASLGKEKLPPKPKQVTTWLENMKRLETLGCKNYQLLEAPHVLDFTEEQVYRQLDIMQQVIVHQVSIPLIGLITPRDNNDFKRRLRFAHYFRRMRGCCSLADLWMDALGCSENDMEGLMLSNPLLFSIQGDFSRRLAKVRFLLDCGVTQNRILKNQKILSNVSLGVLKKRVNDLKALGIGTLPVGYLSQSESPYKKYIHLCQKRASLKARRLEILCGLLNTTVSVLEMHPVLMMTKHRTNKLFSEASIEALEKKIRLLIDTRGYSADDVLNYPKILGGSSVEEFTKAFQDLDEVGLVDIPLKMAHAFMKSNKLPSIRHYNSQQELHKTLCTSVQEMAELVPREYMGLYQQSPMVIRSNLSFLMKECGFERRVIMNLPIVLGHSHSLLVKRWKDLPVRQSKHFTKWRSDSQKLLNLLQYDIEHSANFKHRIITIEDIAE